MGVHGAHLVTGHQALHGPNSARKGLTYPNPIHLLR